VKVLLLDQTVSRARKAQYMQKAMAVWLEAGNHRYGPPGYTLDPKVQEARAPHVDVDESGAPRHPIPRFKEMPAADLRKVAAALPPAHLGDRRRGSPSLRTWAELADVHPDIRFSGEVIGPIHPKES